MRENAECQPDNCTEKDKALRKELLAEDKLRQTTNCQVVSPLLNTAFGIIDWRKQV